MANHAALICDENTGHPVANRGRRFIEFDLGGGKTRHIATIDPLHKRDLLTEIDATWYPDTGAWQWKIGDNDWQAHSRDVFNVGNLIEWRHESDEWIIVDPQSINYINQDYSRYQIAIKQAVTGTTDDCTLTFANAYGSGRHFSYTAHPKRLIKHFIIDSADDLPEVPVWLTGTIHFEVEWVFTHSSGIVLYLDGVKWTKESGVRVKTANRIEFRDAATETQELWYADAPTATDANGDTISAEYEVRNQSGIYFITVRVPLEWMQSAVYPVVIDPTFTDGYGGDVQTYMDTCLNYDGAANNYGTETYIDINCPTSADEWRRRAGLIKFTLSSLEGTTIDSANLYLYHYNTGWTDYGTCYVNRILSANSTWTEAGATWNHAVATSTRWAGDIGEDGGADAGCSQSGTDYSATTMSSIAIGDVSKTLGDEYNFTLGLTEFGYMVDANSGIVLHKSDNTNLLELCSSDHATTGYRPKLVVEYSTGLTVILDTA